MAKSTVPRWWRRWEILDAALALWDRSVWARRIMMGSLPFVGTGAMAWLLSLTSPLLPLLPLLPYASLAVVGGLLIGLPIAWAVREGIGAAVAARERAISIINLPYLSNDDFLYLTAALAEEIYAFLDQRKDIESGGILWSTVPIQEIDPARVFREGQTRSLYMGIFSARVAAIKAQAVSRGLCLPKEASAADSMVGDAELLLEIGRRASMSSGRDATGRS